jgi:hypothetical protein
LWLGFWFVLLVAEPVPVHECAMHNPLAAMRDHQSAPEHMSHGESTESPDQGHSAHHGAKSHKSDTAPAAQQHADAGHPAQGAHLCLCLGCASGSAPVSGAKTATTVPVPAELARVRTTFTLIERSAPEPEFILPPSTAPPTLS